MGAETDEFIAAGGHLGDIGPHEAEPWTKTGNLDSTVWCFKCGGSLYVEDWDTSNWAHARDLPNPQSEEERHAEADFQGRHNRENLGNVIGWVVVDKTTRALDWDGELHPTEEAARSSLDGDRKFTDPDWKPFDLYDVFPVVRTL